MPTGHQLDTFNVSPQRASPLNNPDSLVMGTLGGHLNAGAVESTSVIRVWQSELLLPSQLGQPFNFNIHVVGSIGSHAIGDDLDVQLVAVSGGLDTASETPGTEVDIFDANPLFDLAQQTGDVCWFNIAGSIALEQDGSTSAKIRAAIVGRALQTTPIDGQALSAAAGVAKDLRGGIYLAIDCAFATDGGANSVFQPYSVMALANNRVGSA